jgi:hypothetical protein
MTLVPADSVTVLVNRESANKVASTGAKSWLNIGVNPNGLQAMRAAFESVSREILSKNLTREAGDHVGMTVSPKLIVDLGKDVIDTWGGDMYRCVPTHFGGKTSLYRPSGVTATGYTVAALGDLAQFILIYARGFTNAANNGFKVVGAGSVVGEIKTSGLVVEAGSTANANATVDVVGVVAAAAADFKMDPSGNIMSITTDCTTLNLQPGQWVKLGGTSAGSFFATAALNGWAMVSSAPTTNLIPLTNHSFTPAVDAAAGVSLQIFARSFYRNYPLGHANFSRSTTQLEMEQIGAGPAGVSSFRYAKGLRVGAFELDAPLKSKIVLTLSFVGMDLPAPGVQAARPADTATALAPLAVSMLDTSNDVKYVKLSTSSGNVDLGSEIMSWSLSQNLRLKPQEIQGVLGANGHIDGAMWPSLKIGVYLTTDAIIGVVGTNTDVQFVEALANEDGGYVFHIPASKVNSEDEQMQAGDAVTIDADIPAHRNTGTGITSSLSTFGYVP